jgi:hypothetical protein
MRKPGTEYVRADTIAALSARLAEVEARALLDGIAMSETAMARDRAMTNLSHWRQEVGKLHLRVDLLTARAEAAEAALATARADALELAPVASRLRDAVDAAEQDMALDAEDAAETGERVYLHDYDVQVSIDDARVILALIDKDAAIPAHLRSHMGHERDDK